MKTAIITGSSRGIGLAATKAFCETGYRVVMNCAGDAGAGEAEAAKLRGLGFNAAFVRADVSRYDEAERLFSAAGEPDVLINNAGAAGFGLFSDSGPEDWKRLMDANFNSVLNCSRLAVPSMVKKKDGAIINISSVWGITGASCEAVYSASKGAVNAFSRALGKELAPSGVRVNAIACGAVDTAMNDNLSAAEKEALAAAIPAGRFADAREIAALAVFLASDKARYINAQVITIDGGFI